MKREGGGEGALNELSLSAAHSPACSRGFLKALFAKKPLLDLLCRYGCSFRPPSPSARSFAMQPKERKPSSHCCHARKGACKAVRGEEKAIFEGVALYGYESLLVFLINHVNCMRRSQTANMFPLAFLRQRRRAHSTLGRDDTNCYR